MFINYYRSIVDEICSNETTRQPLKYYQLRKYKKNIPKKIQEITKNNLESILTEFIRDIMIDIYPLDMWKN